MRSWDSHWRDDRLHFPNCPRAGIAHDHAHCWMPGSWRDQREGLLCLSSKRSWIKWTSFVSIHEREHELSLSRTRARGKRSAVEPIWGRQGQITTSDKSFIGAAVIARACS